MKYMKLSVEQRKQMRDAQLLQYEADHLAAELRLLAARAVLADTTATEAAVANAELQVQNDESLQAQLSAAHEAVRAFKTDDAPAPATADAQIAVQS